MADGVSLRAVAEEMEILDQEMHAFLNRQNGEVYGGTSEQLAMAENEDDEGWHDWEREMAVKLREILASPDWIQLPARNTRDDYRIMEEFCWKQCDGKLQQELLAAIAGRGAFRCFRDCVHRWGATDDWYKFRSAAFRESAAEWLESNGIAYGP